MECTDLYVKRIVCVIPLISSDVSHLLIKLFVQSRTSASPRPRASCCWWVTNSTDNLVTWQLSFYLGIRAIGGTRYLGRHQCPVFALHAQLDKMPLPGCRRGRRTTTKPTVALASPPACLLDIGKKKKTARTRMLIFVPWECLHPSCYDIFYSQNIHWIHFLIFESQEIHEQMRRHPYRLIIPILG